MVLLQKKKPKRKRKSKSEKVSLQFNPAEVFDVKGKEELDFNLDTEVLTYRAKKGEAGDRNDPAKSPVGSNIGIALAKLREAASK